MNVGGLQKTSLIDYPGKVSCVLFLAGCNFDCPYCHNPQLVKKPFNFLDSYKNFRVFDFLESRKDFLDAVVITGGEPTIQKDIENICEKVKLLGYLTKLDTNGSKPNVIKELLDKKLLDYIAMDIKTYPSSYSPLIQKNCNTDNIFSSIKLIMESKVPYEFRTTCIRPLINEKIVKNIVELISGAKLYVLQKFNKTKVLHPEFFKKNGGIYNNKELLYFKSLAKPHVKKCLVG
mmetsp:Transcript_22130/g.10513  ORF Transcript_22130/g.10513 Transcript_22130/m.10513 type:complete len:233 (-) Transcript_22130:933-1631(-)